MYKKYYSGLAPFPGNCPERNGSLTAVPSDTNRLVLSILTFFREFRLLQLEGAEEQLHAAWLSTALLASLSGKQHLEPCLHHYLPAHEKNICKHELQTLADLTKMHCNQVKAPGISICC